MRNFLVRLLAPTLAATMAGAADAPPMMEMLVGPGKRLNERFAASIYAKLWNDRVLDSVRAQVAERTAVVQDRVGVSLEELVNAVAGAQVGLERLELPVDGSGQKPRPVAWGQADLGAVATRLMALIREQDPDGSQPVELAGADEAFKPKDSGAVRDADMLLARYGGQLVLGINQEPPRKPAALKPGAADFSLRVDYRSFMAEMEKMAQGDPDQRDAFAAIRSLDRYLAPLTWDMTVVPEGLHERIRQEITYPGMKAVDRTLFARLPDNTLMALAMGFSSKAYWDDVGPALLDLIARDQPGTTPQQVVTLVEQRLTEVGLDLSFNDLVTSIDGSLLLAVTPGAPFPAVTLALPRSPAIDRLLRFAATAMQWEIPADGSSSPLAVPNLPLPMTLIADRGWWVVTSDPAVATTWNAGAPGWSASPAARLAFDQAGPQAALIGASDTNAVLRTAAGFLALVPFTDPKHKQIATVLLARAAAAAGTGYLVGRQLDQAWELETRGLLGFGMFPAMAAAIAIPNLLQARESAGEVAVVGALRSGVFPAQIQFQAGAYIDQNGDNIGEYGFFPELAGGGITGQPDTLKLSLLPEVWNAAQPTVHGYRFTCWLPDGKGGALAAGDGLRAQNAAAAKAQSERFVVYAWSMEAGKPIYALTQTGTIYSTTAVEAAAGGPAWNALFEGGGWEDEPTWEQYRRR